MARTEEIKATLQALNKEIHAKRAEMVEVLRLAGPEPVDDHTLVGPEGPVTLSSLFGDKPDLVVIHNMGASCPYCTLWADGFNGMRAHFEDRAAFVVVSPDTPEQQKAFADSRGWTMRMVSNGDSGFTEAMGFTVEQDGQTWQMPGYSTFRKAEDGSITRIAYDHFGPGDAYNAIWHMFPLLADGVNDWQPKFTYDA